MSDADFDAIESHVGRAVRSLPASPWRKRAMHEELIAHVAGAYEQELGQTCSPGAALTAALTRFGNLDLIRQELLASVPAAERLIFTFFSPREWHMRRWTWVLIGIAMVLVGMAIVLPALAQMKQHQAAFAGQVAMGVLVGGLIVLLGLGSMGYAVVRRTGR